MLFEIKEIDRQYYEDRLRGFLPDVLIDIHAHVWPGALNVPAEAGRFPTWPNKVASSNSIEDLHESYRLLFPGKKVLAAAFTHPDYDLPSGNAYIARCAEDGKLFGLLMSRPEWSREVFERQLCGRPYCGAKVYLNFAPEYIPRSEIRIFDFLPPHQLEVLNRHGKIVMLHIPRDQRIRDPVNLAQMIEIEERFPDVKLIIAHVGRAYCDGDVGDAFDVIRNTRKMMFDISANTNSRVFEQLIDAVGPERILFGSDLPITRMRMRRIIEENRYINLVPKGLYGDVGGDPNLREVEGREAERLSFFLYEEIDAFRRAAEKTGLSIPDVENVFYGNANNLLGSSNGIHTSYEGQSGREMD